MIDTQPTKFCVECKYHYVANVAHLEINGTCYVLEDRCSHIDRKRTPVNLVNGYTQPLRHSAWDVRENECKGEWWEEKPNPEPLTVVSVPVTAKTGTVYYRPSIFQRIKRWFK